MLKRLISIFVCICLILPMMPTARAISGETAGPVTGPELVPAGTVDSEAYCATLEQAGKLVREQMKARQQTVTVHYCKNGAYDDVSDGIMEEALKHTGVPTEGDSIGDGNIAD